jgi:hypothetical protein
MDWESIGLFAVEGVPSLRDSELKCAMFQASRPSLNSAGPPGLKTHSTELVVSLTRVANLIFCDRRLK